MVKALVQELAQAQVLEQVLELVMVKELAQEQVMAKV